MTVAQHITGQILNHTLKNVARNIIDLHTRKNEMIDHHIYIKKMYDLSLDTDFTNHLARLALFEVMGELEIRSVMKDFRNEQVGDLIMWHSEASPPGLVFLDLWYAFPVVYASNSDTAVLIRMTF